MTKSKRGKVQSTSKKRKAPPSVLRNSKVLHLSLAPLLLLA